MIPAIPFYFLRHGQTDWNLEGRLMGQKDIPLNAQGIEEAKKSRHMLLGQGIKTICHSPLLRAKMTSEIYNELLGCEMIPIPELQEFNLGRHSGQLIGPWLRKT